jgi:uncharacterized protein (TIGR03067 family)
MRRVLPLFSILPLAFAPAPVYKATPSQHDLKAMQGEWRLVQLIDGDKALATHRTIKIDKDQISFLDEKKGGASTFRIALDANNVPKAIDLSPLESDRKGERILGIYKFDNDTLRLSFNYSTMGKSRPQGHATKHGQNAYVLKRLKP